MKILLINSLKVVSAIVMGFILLSLFYVVFIAKDYSKETKAEIKTVELSEPINFVFADTSTRFEPSVIPAMSYAIDEELNGFHGDLMSFEFSKGNRIDSFETGRLKVYIITKAKD